MERKFNNTELVELKYNNPIYIDVRHRRKSINKITPIFGCITSPVPANRDHAWTLDRLAAGNIEQLAALPLFLCRRIHNHTFEFTTPDLIPTAASIIAPHHLEHRLEQHLHTRFANDRTKAPHDSVQFALRRMGSLWHVVFQIGVKR